MEDEEIKNYGPQPLGDILGEVGLDNHDLVNASTEQLTHKQVQKARKGRRVTKNIQKKVFTALVAALAEKSIEREVRQKDLFNYRA
tara:strand:- start:1075 stop:1332 length:258 start_codon:yes stop_codon:yes gene_type:complete